MYGAIRVVLKAGFEQIAVGSTMQCRREGCVLMFRAIIPHLAYNCCNGRHIEHASLLDGSQFYAQGQLYKSLQMPLSRDVKRSTGDSCDGGNGWYWFTG